jgi:short-subunit dehydrogenase
LLDSPYDTGEIAAMTEREESGRRVLVTGASAGIGSAFAGVFAEHGFDVVLTARREDRLTALARQLERTHGIRAIVIPADLSDPAAPQKLFDETRARGLTIDALVNNAGYAVPFYFRSSPWQEHAKFIQVMVTAVAHLTHLFEPGMLERGYGRIINVASIAGLVPSSAGLTLYGASKAFVIKFSEALAAEHAGDGVHVTAVCPGYTHSEFHDVVGNRQKVERLPWPMWMDAEAVARQSYAAVMAGEVLLINGVVNRGIAAVARLGPQRAIRAVLRAGTRRLRRLERDVGAGGQRSMT